VVNRCVSGLKRQRPLARLVRIDPKLLCPVKHRSAWVQADLTGILARAGLVRARTALVNTARGLAKSYGERLRGCNVRNMNPEKAQGLSPEVRDKRMLAAYLAGKASVADELVFPSEAGTPLNGSNLHSRYFVPRLRKHEFGAFGSMILVTHTLSC
jgi:hypothetical protein